ncbi:GNAT family N-acetyltransferase [Halomonas halmophila]|uniref:Acetyltransferase n=1 Tax=Halomonas halmophila TaxID=252 RepID=A0A4Y4F0P5_9GAMM|nr:GNAT family N-acetyltransferase [Halomonas halmophila]GED22956.1 acetyltransferase [Halomonas halmophila]
MHIRRFRTGEERELFEVFHSAIHLVASRDYTPAQINAWAPGSLDQELWARKMRDIKPFVAEIGETIVGYADVQPSGYIDHFFVSGLHSSQGVGTLLMLSLHSEAISLGLTELTSDVSLTAQPFFEKFGFCIIERRAPELRGVVVPNALMRKVLS